MKLLLLISALLSALTGVAGARAPSVTPELSQLDARRAAPAPARIARATRPDIAPSSQHAPLRLLGRALRLAAAIPPYTERRRE